MTQFNSYFCCDTWSSLISTIESYVNSIIKNNLPTYGHKKNDDIFGQTKCDLKMNDDPFIEPINSDHVIININEYSNDKEHIIENYIDA